MKRLLLLLPWLTAAPIHAAVPAVDALAAAPVLTSSAWVEPCSTVGANLDFNEPILSGLDESRTVWWKWIAPVTGTPAFAQGSEWARRFASCVAVALDRPVVRIDVPGFVVG